MSAPFQPLLQQRDPHAARVRAAKFVIAALISAGAALGLVYVSGDEPTPLAAVGGSSAEAEGPVMTRPRFHGTDGEGRPFNVYAEQALWRKNGVVGLRKIKADAADGAGSKAEMQADEGEYNHAERTLVLRGDVYLDAVSPERTLNLATNEVTVEMRGLKAYGPGEVRAVSDALALRADRFQLDGEHGRAVFEGGVQVTVSPEALASEQDTGSTGGTHE